MKKGFLIIAVILSPVFLFSQESPAELEFVSSDTGYLGAPAWSPDERYFASVDNGKIIIRHAETNAKVYTFSDSDRNSKITSIEFNRNGKLLLALRSDSSIVIYNIETFSPVDKLRLSESNVSKAIFSIDNYGIIFPLDGKNIYEYFKLFETDNFLLRRKFSCDSEILVLSISNDGGRLLAGCADGKVRLIDTDSKEWKLLNEYSYNAKLDVLPKIAPDGKSCILPHTNQEIDIVVFDDDNMNSDPHIITIVEPEGFSGDISFSSDGKFIVTGTKAGNIKIISTENGAVERQISLENSEKIRLCSFGPLGKKVLIMTGKGGLYKWNLRTDKFSYFVATVEGADSTGINANTEGKDSSIYIYSEDGTLDGGKGEKAGSEGTGSTRIVKLKEETKTGFYGEGALGFRTFQSPFGAGITASFTAKYFGIIEPFYVAARIEPFVGFPEEDFPYKYTINGEQIKSPLLGGAEICIPFGAYFMPFKDMDIEFDAEVFAGATFSFLGNRKFGQSGVISKIFPSFTAGAKVTGRYEFLFLYASVKYDTLHKFSFGMGAGISFKLGGRS